MHVPLPVDVLQCLTGRRALRVHSVTLRLSAQTSDSRTTSAVTQLGRMIGDVASSVGEHGREKLQTCDELNVARMKTKRNRTDIADITNENLPFVGRKGGMPWSNITILTKNNYIT